jgi:putative transposase
MKEVYPWLAKVPSQALQQCLMQLDKAYVNFFEKRAKFPKFKKRGCDSTGIHFPQGVEVNGRCIYFPKLGWIKARFSQNIQGKIKNGTIKFNGVRWVASIQVEIEEQEPQKITGDVLGIDMGVEETIATSEGVLVSLPIATERELKHIRLLERNLSRCVVGSIRRGKAKKRLLKYKRSVLNRVNDARHKLTTWLAKNHSLLVVEALQLNHMTRSAAGTVEEPGTNVAQKTGLNRSLLEQGLGELRRQLEYKAEWYGSECMRVGPAHTSQTCPCCKHVGQENRKTRSQFKCVKCGLTGHADVIAAINILIKGLVEKGDTDSLAKVMSTLKNGLAVGQTVTVRGEPKLGIRLVGSSKRAPTQNTKLSNLV